MQIIINDIPKVSFNVYNSMHWSDKKRLKDTIKILVLSSTRAKFKGSYTLKFTFGFKGRKLDTINCVHFAKMIEDVLFKQDNQNREICLNVEKSDKNYCKLILTKNI